MTLQCERLEKYIEEEEIGTVEHLAEYRILSPITLGETLTQGQIRTVGVNHVRKLLASFVANPPRDLQDVTVWDATGHGVPSFSCLLFVTPVPISRGPVCLSVWAAHPIGLE